jgi:putative flippase GtrA
MPNIRKNATRFLLVGMGAFAIDYGLTLCLHYLFGVTGYVASAISFIISFTFSYSLSRKWVFRSKSTYKYSLKQQVTFYFILATLNLVISTLAIGILGKLHVEVYISKALVVAMIATWNFIIGHTLIFAEEKV